MEKTGKQKLNDELRLHTAYGVLGETETEPDMFCPSNGFIKYEIKPDPYEVEYGRNLNTHSGSTKKFVPTVNPYMLKPKNSRPSLMVKRSLSQNE